MNRSYSGNDRPFAAVLFPAEDASAVLPVLEAMQQSGVALCCDRRAVQKSVLRRATAVILFFTAHFGENEALLSAALYARSQGIPLLPVDMPGGSCPEVLAPFVYARNHVDVSRYSTPEELGQRLAEAEPFQSGKPSPAQQQARRRGLLAIILAAAVFAGLALWFFLKMLPGLRAEPVAETPEGIPARKLWEMTDAELAKLKDVCIIGDAMVETDNPYGQDGIFGILTELYEYEEDKEVTYLWMADVAGHEAREFVSPGVETDFSILAKMTGLEHLYLIEQNCRELPSLAGCKSLAEVSVLNCPLESVDCLAGCSSLTSLRLQSTLVKDLSGLSSCERLSALQIRDHRDPELCSLKSLRGLPAGSLESLELVNCHGLSDLSGLGDCSRMERLLLDVSIEDVSCLSGLTSLKQLEFNDYGDVVTDLGSLGSLTGLESLSVWSSGVEDAGFLSGLPSLRYAHLLLPYVTDWSPLSNHPALTELSFPGYAGENLDFLKGLGKNVSLTMGINSPLKDVSGLACVKSYAKLDLDFWGGAAFSNGNAVLEALRSSEAVDELILGHASLNGLGSVPGSVKALTLRDCDLSSLKGLGQAKALSSLILENCSPLQSLDGLQGCQALQSVTVTGCTALTDASALYSIDSLALLRWENMPSFPVELAKLHPADPFSLAVVNVPSVDSLDFLLDTAEQIRYKKLELSYLPLVTDLSPLQKLSGETLSFPSHLEVQAERAVEMGLLHFSRYQTVVGDGVYFGYETANPEESLTDLSQLETMDPARLSFVYRFCLAGDTLLTEDMDSYQLLRDGTLYDPAAGAAVPAGEGFLTDLEPLSALTGLRTLHLIRQPLTDISGIQGFPELTDVSFRDCSDLTDVSPLFSLTGPERLDLSGTGVRDLTGIRNLRELTLLDLRDTPVTDLTPLLGLENLRTVRVSASMEEVVRSLGDSYSFTLEWDE